MLTKDDSRLIVYEFMSFIRLKLFHKTGSAFVVYGFGFFFVVDPNVFCCIMLGSLADIYLLK